MTALTAFSVPADAPLGVHTVRVATQTGAPVAIAPIGADYLAGQGLSAGQIHSVPGLGDGDVLYGSGFTATRRTSM